MNLVGMLGKMLISNAMGGRRGGGNVLGSLLGGGGGGGLGSMLGGAGGGAGGGLGGMLGGLMGGQAGGAAGGGAGGLLGGLLGGGQGGQSAQGGAGGLLGQVMGGQQPAQAPSAAENDQAALLIRAMVNAAKSDGEIEAQEQQNIVSKLGGEVGPEEAEFIRSEMAAPLDVNAFVRSVPSGMEKDVYVISLMAINLDSKPEAVYLDQLAKGMNISEQESNQIHSQLGVGQLYT